MSTVVEDPSPSQNGIIEALVQLVSNSRKLLALHGFVDGSAAPNNLSRDAATRRRRAVVPADIGAPGIPTKQLHFHAKGRKVAANHAVLAISACESPITLQTAFKSD
jgi:hypothetical protein